MKIINVDIFSLFSPFFLWGLELKLKVGTVGKETWHLILEITFTVPLKAL